MNIFFYTAATVALVSSILTITRHNAIHALLYLILSLLSISVIFYLLGSAFHSGSRGYYLRRSYYGFVHFCSDDAECRYGGKSRKNVDEAQNVDSAFHFIADHSSGPCHYAFSEGKGSDYRTNNKP